MKDKLNRRIPTTAQSTFRKKSVISRKLTNAKVHARALALQSLHSVINPSASLI
jgi:hypothetical protein